MRVRAALVMVCVLLALPAGARADNVFGDEEIVVAVIDTGIHATHQEFDYRGRDSDDDQIVAWWDFTDTAGEILDPRMDQIWDERYPDPYDDEGHGTATAALAVGRNVGPESSVAHSLAPGAKLAVARVCTNRVFGACTGDIATAIRWATEAVRADVITISIGYIVPLPELLPQIHEAAREARRAGVLVLVANGNGFGNAGGPAPGWATPFADSTEVLTVGASDVWGATVTTDPEVVAPFRSVKVASNECDTCYGTSSGTSFSTPYVAGAAASAMRIAVENGRDAGPVYIEQLLKYAARDTAMPPSFEGYGIVDAQQLPLIAAHAAAGTMPKRPDPDLNALYVEGVAGTLREAWSNQLDSGRAMYEPLPLPVQTGPLLLGRGYSPGIAEVERFTVTLTRNEVLTVSASARYEFFDLHMYLGTGPTFSGKDLVANARYGSPTIVYRSPVDATFTVIVAGFSVLTGELAFTVTGSTSTRPDGVLVWDGQGYYRATALYLN